MDDLSDYEKEYEDDKIGNSIITIIESCFILADS